MSAPDATAQSPFPRFRGRLHQGAFVASIPAGLSLVALAQETAARIGAVIYSLTLIGLYGVSAAYHRIPWSAAARRRMKRLDHSMIYVLIAGTYTPLSLLALRGAWRVSILAVVWGGAITGVVAKMVRIDGLRAIGGAMYIILGWFAVIAMPQLFHRLDAAMIVLLFSGGILYTVGAILFMRRRPDPNPSVFGYHEVWHSFVVTAGACHYVMVLLLILAAR